MNTKNLLLLSTVSFLFYQCINNQEDEEFNSINSPILQQKDSLIEIDSIRYFESIKNEKENETDPPKDKDPYIKKNGTHYQLINKYKNNV